MSHYLLVSDYLSGLIAQHLVPTLHINYWLGAISLDLATDVRVRPALRALVPPRTESSERDVDMTIDGRADISTRRQLPR